MIDPKKFREVQERGAFYPDINPPSFWKKVLDGEDGALFRYNGLAVIISGKREKGVRWVHVSLSRSKRMPEYNDIKMVKKHFIGDEKAIMVFPKEEEFVNIHKYCLHMFTCLDKDPLPDFTSGTGSL